MSWQQYIDNLTGTKQVAKAGIYGADGSHWACSPDLQPKPAELASMIKGFSDPNPLYASGVRINDVKYVFLRTNEDGTGLYFKKGTTGGVLAKAGKCFVLGMYDEGMQPGACNTQVEKIAAYLKDAGY